MFDVGVRTVCVFACACRVVIVWTLVGMNKSLFWTGWISYCLDKINWRRIKPTIDTWKSPSKSRPRQIIRKPDTSIFIVNITYSHISARTHVHTYPHACSGRWHWNYYSVVDIGIITPSLTLALLSYHRPMHMASRFFHWTFWLSV